VSRGQRLRKLGGKENGVATGPEKKEEVYQSRDVLNSRKTKSKKNGSLTGKPFPAVTEGGKIPNAGKKGATSAREAETKRRGRQERREGRSKVEKKTP